jgi:hypothetical protein
MYHSSTLTSVSVLDQLQLESVLKLSSSGPVSFQLRPSIIDTNWSIYHNDSTWELVLIELRL